MQQEQQNIRSTKSTANRIARCTFQPAENELVSTTSDIIAMPDHIEDDCYPPMEPKVNEIVFKIEKTSKVFPIKRGNFHFRLVEGINMF